MAHSFDLDKPQKRYCIRGKHAAIICVTVVVCSVTVGLAVGLSRSDKSIQSTPAPTTEPSKPPPPDRGPCLPSTDSNGDWKNFRLPDYVTPVHYDLLLEPDLIDDVYSGTVDVHVEVTEPTRHLWLHIRETFVSAKPRLKKLGGPGGLEDIPVKSCFEYKLHQYVVVEASEVLPITAPGEVYVLSLDFQGSLTGSVVGFYRVVYTENGQTKKIAATDHEPTDARKSFPCFDEPNKKATYNISIVNDDAYSALSNMPMQGSPQPFPEGKIKTNFQKSVLMSTYLVCFAVHQFTYVERTSQTNIPLRIYTQPSQIATAEYAADTTKIVFDYFQEYFDMEYSLPKLDKIAIPDFGTGAMENWGLITYRETNLLYDDQQSSSSNKKQVAKVIAHELVHQWFGNIVTMDWWDDLWLNEGFASFFEYIGVEKAEPEWDMRDIMITDDVLPVMVDDARLSSHPIIVNVSTPDEITAVFDAISYSKGASILRMLEDWMGKDAFRDGCRKYLKDYTFKNAKTANFWASLTNVSGLPVAEVMDTWTKQMGYPVVNLSVSITGAKLTQKRFLLDPTADPNETPSPFGYKWTIPVRWYSLKSNTTSLSIFDRTSPEHILDLYSPSEDGLLKVNNNHMGFYRVNHDDLMWDAISEQLQSNLLVFDAADRASYMDDVFALSRANLIDYGNAFNLTQYLTGEGDYIVWQRVDASIAYIQDMLSGQEELYSKFQKLFQNHVKGITEKLGFNDTGTHTERMLRETVIDIACQMGDLKSLSEMSNIFDQWINGTIANIPVNLRLLVYRYGMKTSDNVEHWEIMFQRYKNTTLAQEKVKLLYGLASVQNVTLLYRLLEATKDQNVVRSQDLFTVVRYVSYNQMGLDMAWDWTTLNWDYLVQRYTINDRNLGRLLTQISTTYNTELQKWKMEHFFTLTPNSGAGELSRKQGLETVSNNIDWISNNRDEIKRWLDNNVFP